MPRRYLPGDYVGLGDIWRYATTRRDAQGVKALRVHCEMKMNPLAVEDNARGIRSVLTGCGVLEPSLQVAVMPWQEEGNGDFTVVASRATMDSYAVSSVPRVMAGGWPPTFGPGEDFEWQRIRHDGVLEYWQGERLLWEAGPEYVV